MSESTLELLYVGALALTMIAWLALIRFPRQTWANFWFAGIIVPLVLGLLYSGVFLISWFQKPQGQMTGFLSLPGLGALFLNHGLLLAGFIDLLMMPLIVGAWMARKAAQVNMPYKYLLPCLVLTPAIPGSGFVVFVLITAIKGGLPEVAELGRQPATSVAPVLARPRAG